MDPPSSPGEKIPKGEILDVTVRRMGLVVLVLAFVFWTLSGPCPALADSEKDGESCDPLEATWPGEGTEWTWFPDRTCPDSSQDDGGKGGFRGFGLTFTGSVLDPTSENILNNSDPSSFPIVPMERGFGGGIKINAWLAADVDVRLELDYWSFAQQSPVLSMAPATLGLELRLFGDDDVFAYAAGDAGIAAIDGAPSQNLFGKGTSGAAFYQLGVGMNVYFFDLEVDYAMVPSPVVDGRAVRPFFIVPLTLGVHL